MTCKTIEIRDRGTFVPALLVRLDPADERDRWLLSRAGFGTTPEAQREYVLLINLVKDCPYDPFGHGSARTLQVAHQHAIEAFDRLENGAVVDVEYLLDEQAEPKVSEQETVRA
jgi:hypothetical protein